MHHHLGPTLTTAWLLAMLAPAAQAQLLPNSSQADGFASDFGSNYGLFSADDHVQGRELWRFDQTSHAVAIVKDIAPGGTGSYPREITAFLGAYVFAADDGTHGTELWRSNGTAAGTTMVMDIALGGSSNPHDLTVVGSRLFFVADDGSHGDELWTYDGTTTTLVKDIRAGVTSSSPDNFCGFGGVLYFAANDGTTGSELWRSDGTTAGTTLVKDIKTGTTGSVPHNLSNASTYLLFVADDGSHGAEPWRSDGTTAGTVLLKDLEPGSVGSAPGPATWLQQSMFAATTTANGRELWKSDGTTAGTIMVANIVAGAASSDPDDIVAATPFEIWFAAGPATNRQIWSTVATSSTVTQRTTLPPGTDPGHLTLTATTGRLVFANGGTNELWVTDSSVPGASLLTSFRSGPSDLVRNTNLAGGVLGAPVVFGAEDTTHGTELWITNGTAGGTTMVANLAPETPGVSYLKLRQHADASGTWVTVCVDGGPPFAGDFALIAFSATQPTAGVSLPGLSTGPIFLSSILTTLFALCDANGEACVTVNLPTTFSSIEFAEQGFALDISTGLPFSSSDLGSLGLTSTTTTTLFGGETNTLGVFDDSDHRFEVSIRLPGLVGGTPHPTGTLSLYYRKPNGTLTKPVNDYSYDGRSTEIFIKDTMAPPGEKFDHIEMWFHPDNGSTPVMVWRTYC